MAIVLPEINPELITNRGEQIFYEAACRLPDAYTVFYNYEYITEGGLLDNNAYYEADFVITHPWLGYLVIEVKGGHYRFQNNRWQKRLGEVYVDTEKDPVAQAKRAMFFILERYKEEARADSFPLQIRYAVCFPDCEVFKGQAPAHLREESIWLSTDLVNLDKSIRAVFGRQASQPNGQAINLLKQKVLAPGFSVYADLESEIRIFSKKSGKIMTDEQKRILDETELDRRKIYLGAAGTGKTFIAIEKVKRLVEAGKKVLMTCFNRDLASYLQDELNDELNSGYLTLTNFHDYIFNRVIESGISVVVPEDQAERIVFFKEELPQMAMDVIDKMPVEEKFDALVVDEGQDFREEWYLILLELLKCNQSGEFYIFADPTQDLFNADFKALSSFEVSYHRLTRNLRNTEKINNWLAELTSIEPMQCIHKGGEQVTFFPWQDAAEEKQLVIDAVDNLANKGVLPGRVVILSPRLLQNSSLAGIDSVGNWPLFDLRRRQQEAIEKPADAVAFNTIRAFKGLEADIVFLIGIKTGSKVCTINDIYVGCSRACFLLYIFHEEGFQFAKNGEVEVENKMELEKQFHQDMINIYQRANVESNYQPTYFLKMVSELGGVETAKRLLKTPNAQQGFGTLQKLGRLDLSMEAHVIKPEYATLFSDAEIDEARERLERQGYFKTEQEVSSNVVVKKRDSVSNPESSAIEKFKTDKEILHRLRNFGVPWRGVQENLKEKLPETLEERERVAYDLVPKAMTAVFGKQDVGWMTEKRASKSGHGQTTWILITGEEEK